MALTVIVRRDVVLAAVVELVLVSAAAGVIIGLLTLPKARGEDLFQLVVPAVTTTAAATVVLLMVSRDHRVFVLVVLVVQVTLLRLRLRLRLR